MRENNSNYCGWDKMRPKIGESFAKIEDGLPGPTDIALPSVDVAGSSTVLDGIER